MTEIDFSLLAADEVVGIEFYKTYPGQKTGGVPHEVVWRVIYMTKAGTLPEPHHFSGTIREMARQHDGIILERVDDNSKAMPKGTRIWKRRAWIDVNSRLYANYQRQGFKTRRKKEVAMPDTTDYPTLEQRWEIIEPALHKHGVETDKIKTKIQRELIIRQVEADEVIGEDDDVWRDYVNELLEEHPAWASAKHKRLKNAEALIQGWHEGWGDIGSNPLPSELASFKYAVLSWYDGSGIVRPAGDNYSDICELIYHISYSEENPESADFYMDLDTGTRHDLRKEGLKTTITIELHGEVFTSESIG